MFVRATYTEKTRVRPFHSLPRSARRGAASSTQVTVVCTCPSPQQRPPQPKASSSPRTAHQRRGCRSTSRLHPPTGTVLPRATAPPGLLPQTAESLAQPGGASPQGVARPTCPGVAKWILDPSWWRARPLPPNFMRTELLVPSPPEAFYHRAWRRHTPRSIPKNRHYYGFNPSGYRTSLDHRGARDSTAATTPPQPAPCRLEAASPAPPRRQLWI